MAPCSGRRKFKKLSGVDTQMCTFVVATPILRLVQFRAVGMLRLVQFRAVGMLCSLRELLAITF